MIQATNAGRQLTAAQTNVLRDIKPPVEIPNGWIWVFCGAGALVLAGILFLAWRYWKQKQQAAMIAPIIPPNVRARRKLEQALRLIGEPREFCICVSDTIRLYLEERFNFHAPDRTTEEFLHELQATDLLTRAQKDSLADFLNRCDLVKFAKYEPHEPELRDLHGSALRLVEETEPVVNAVQAPGAQQPVEANE